MIAHAQIDTAPLPKMRKKIQYGSKLLEIKTYRDVKAKTKHEQGTGITQHDGQLHRFFDPRFGGPTLSAEMTSALFKFASLL